MTLTPLQCRMARAALDLSIRDLAGQAGVPVTAVSRFENGQAIARPRVERLGAVLVAMGIVLLPEQGGDGVGVRLGRTFRKGFIFGADGRQVASILGETVIDAIGGHAVGTVRGEQVFALTGEALGALRSVDLVGETGSLAETALQALRETGLPLSGRADVPPAALLLEAE